jgi:hypothetical protein
MSKEKVCLCCGEILTGKQRKFCSIKCKDKLRYDKVKIEPSLICEYIKCNEPLVQNKRGPMRKYCCKGHRGKQAYLDKLKREGKVYGRKGTKGKCLFCGEQVKDDSRWANYCNQYCYSMQRKIDDPEYIRRSYLKNINNRRSYGRRYARDHKKEIKEYKKNNKVRTNTRHRERRKNCYTLRINDGISGGIYRSLNKRGISKSGRHWEKLVGYTIDELKEHLESLFVAGMTKKNYGKLWHIDHIKPLSSFSIESIDDPNIKLAWKMSNLQPLFWWENLEKCDKLDWVRDPPHILAQKICFYIGSEHLLTYTPLKIFLYK